MRRDHEREGERERKIIVSGRPLHGNPGGIAKKRTPVKTHTHHLHRAHHLPSDEAFVFDIPDALATFTDGKIRSPRKRLPTMRFTGRYIQNIETLFDFENLPLERTKDGANERMTEKERERREGKEDAREHKIRKTERERKKKK